MDVKVVLALALVITASGCVGTGPGSETSVDQSTSSGNGLEVEQLRVSDSTLSTSQNAIMTLVLKNYHTNDIEIEDVSVYNTGFLEFSDPSCSPEPGELGTASSNFAPEMECTWQLTAPDSLDGQSSKNIATKLNIEYESYLQARTPFKINFMRLENINRSNPTSKTYDNGEVQISLESESPAPREGRMVDVDVQNVGPGRIDSGYSFDYTPSDVLQDCIENHAEKEPVSGSEVSFSCRAESEQTATRNLLISTSYKYIKSPTLDIEVVNR